MAVVGAWGGGSTEGVRNQCSGRLMWAGLQAALQQQMAELKAKGEESQRRVAELERESTVPPQGCDGVT